jgi:deazaflavin-dependent oxidoreductase (nitroreductase family)
MAHCDSGGEEQFLYLTTTGRKTGQPREIEIWFVALAGSFYVLAEHFHRAQWVLNIRKTPRVHVRVGARIYAATATTLDRERDATEWRTVQELARKKYGWGEGLPVRITPVGATADPAGAPP